MPTPILPYSINLVLQYISPPSQLDAPVPPHLLSRPLLQRHLFLDISPEDSPSYLTWASPHRDRAIQLLESLPKPIDDHTSSCFPVRYTSDGEETYAHVHIDVTTDYGDSLRLVFLWDGESTWAYHDAGLMPFPTNARPSLTEAIATSGVEDLAIHVPVNGHQSDSAPDHSDSGDDDDYWNSYAYEDGEDAPTHLTRRASKDPSETGEDAYWAQYASVQGTADSTIPSPVQKTRKRLHPATDEDPHHIAAEVILPIPPASFHHQRAKNDKEPPSPHSLTRRLHAISPRNSRPPSTPASQLDPVFDALTEQALGGDAEGDADADKASESPDDESTPSPAELSVGASSDSAARLDTERTPEPDTRERILSPQPRKANGVSFLRESQDEDSDQVANDGVKEAIRGVYRLWKATGGGRGADEFLRLVSEVVEQS
ncbi:hypothetical protein FA95DRAFT_1563546 [Auriscalpium vulgare]|uniref:Uncharacterized protein n=1 Tax=Auriscalpium vulgare TaxID=40419 RepID=A0ACB8RH14_9AGAM|nr:hypothetical protein FA95DRAFT_1563546 [Auriscalpium vulgare]